MSLLITPGGFWGYKLSKVDIGRVTRESGLGLSCFLVDKKVEAFSLKVNFLQ